MIVGPPSIGTVRVRPWAGPASWTMATARPSRSSSMVSGAPQAATSGVSVPVLLVVGAVDIQDADRGTVP